MTSQNLPVQAERIWICRLTMVSCLALFIMCLTGAKPALAGELKALALLFEAGKFISLWNFGDFSDLLPSYR